MESYDTRFFHSMELYDKHFLLTWVYSREILNFHNPLQTQSILRLSVFTVPIETTN